MIVNQGNKIQLLLLIKSTKVQTLGTNTRPSSRKKNGRLCMVVKGLRAVSLQRSGFRKKSQTSWRSSPSECMAAFSGPAEAPWMKFDLTDTQTQLH